MDPARRLLLLSLNTSPSSPPSSKLDSSLKRHSTLLTRLRSLQTPSNLPLLLTDLTQLSLSKHLSEIISATLEGVSKCRTGGEVVAAVEVVGLLWRRFGAEFGEGFESGLVKGLEVGGGEGETGRVRAGLRVLSELELTGVVGKGERGEVTWGVLKDLLTKSKENLELVAPLAIGFVKYCGAVFLLTESASSSGEFPSLAAATTTGQEGVLVSLAVQEKFRKLLLAYLEALTKKEVKRHLELQTQDRKNHEAYIRSGEVFEDREKLYEKNVRAWERGWASVNSLSELLHLPPPALPTLPSTQSLQIISSTTPLTAADEEASTKRGKWGDEEEKKFYESLREISREVPKGLLGVKVEVEDVEVEETAEEGDEGEVEVEEEVVRVEEEESLPAAPAAQLTALLAKLEEASSITAIDGIAVEFGFLNSKAARNRLIKFLGGVNRNRVDVVPFYARLVATLDPFMKDVAKGLIVILEDEFKWLMKKKGTDLAETRTKNLRFLSELTKFSLLPPHKIFHIYKVLLDDFSSPSSLDALIVFLEGCGRFCLKSEGGVGEKMRGVMERCGRLMKACGGAALDGWRLAALENAWYQCDPPERPVVVQKERSPMQLYVRHLFYNVLSRNSSDKVLKLVRKLHWDDEFIVGKLRSAFTKVWKIKYSNVHLFAVLLYDLGKYHPEFNVDVIDQVLENVRAGMEVNSFKYNQQRVATIKYLGELYNYRVVDSRVIFDTLWSLVTFGHPEGKPWPDQPSPIDSPDDCFRVRLVCTLLDTCGSCFERGALKKKLDSFLIFFQMYALSKGTMPMDVEFMLADTFEQLRPNLVLFKTFAEASQAVDEMMAAVAKNGLVEEELDEQLDEERDAVENEMEEDEAASSGDESESSQVQVESSDDETTAARRKDPNAITQEEEDEFNRELAKMMINSGGDNRKAPDRKPALMDVGVPVLRRTKRGWIEAEEEERKKECEGGLTFTLLTKKGTKQQTFLMEIPRDSSIAVHTLEKRAQDKAEQQELKRRVLDYESREEASEKEALKATLARRGVNLRFVNPKSNSKPT